MLKTHPVSNCGKPKPEDARALHKLFKDMQCSPGLNFSKIDSVHTSWPPFRAYEPNSVLPRD
ncbi:unnamed protein product [Dovyalis caffra]|uniref:Uncharacterized protein n=1 Tax=Dovyalis caffra TaxID=77055 RepID=A0AAV1ST46_9ROSI|nr:unnamed protein product [Dovyalis caffra]